MYKYKQTNKQFSNMENREKITICSNGIQIRKIIDIPFCNKQQHGADFDLDKIRQRSIAYSLDLLGSYSKLLIASLERRIRACKENLLNHLNDIEYADECGHIVYVRKDGTRGNFNVPSYKAMEDAVKALKMSCFKDFLSNNFWIDQTLKALLNDTKYNPVDIQPFKYSELITLLCESHIQPHFEDEIC